MLTEKMTRWAELKAEISALEAEISAEVQAIGKTIDAGPVRASYTAGRRSYDYQAIAAHINVPEALVEKHTTTRTDVRTDWRALVLEVKPAEEIVEQFCTAGTPSVTLKILPPKADR